MSGRSLARPWLLPLTPLYRLALAGRELRLRRGWEPVRRLRLPVISIGNLSTGGAGKTPFAIALAKGLTARGYAVDVLSRGYGRKTREPATVDPAGTAEDFGDEPVLIARDAGVPVFVATHRYQAGLLAESHPGCPRSPVLGPGNPLTLDRAQTSHERSWALAPEGRFLHILDDAFQHRQLHRDINILLLDREDWRDGLLPAGNLREPLSAIHRADVIALTENEDELARELRAWGWEGPVWRLRRCMEVPHLEGPAFAFCGIARPEQFFSGLEAAGVRLAGRLSFPDHHRYTLACIDRLQSAAQSAGAVALITTAKDAVRLAGLIHSPKPGLPVLTAGLRIEICDHDAALDWLARRLDDTAVRQSL